MSMRQIIGQTFSAVLVVGLCVSPAWSRTLAQKKKIARTQFESAERMREALNGRPEGERNARDYQRVIDAYRRVYYTAPTSVKADASVVAVAELLAEKGHLFKDDKALNDAIGQYEFLRREYPGSRYRAEALFTMGQIYEDDLHEHEQARATFDEFLKRYPNSQLADDARQAVREIEEAGKSKEAKTQTAGREAEEQRENRLLVTGVRHWSTPDYTRVAIDLEGEVEYTSDRIGHPDRIYFDLKGTRLTSTLKGKSFEVEDGFLKKIRVAQFQPGQTRVVLEVDSVSEFSSFLLPNPYRLIIDIHGKKAAATTARTRPSRPPVMTTEVAPKTEAKAEAPKPAATAMNGPGIRARPLQGTADIKIVDSPAAPAKPPAAAIPAARNSTASPARGEAAEPEPAGKTEAANPGSVVAAKAQVGKAGGGVPIKIADAPGLPPKSKRTGPPSAAREARPTAVGDRSLIRALGLKIGRIVVDAGHGGHDTGTIGPHGFAEKDLVLDVALRLGKLLETRLRADVIYTRDDDTFVPLETRTAIANQKQADLFISIHANSSSDSAARGVETYYLNFTSSPSALEVAARENAVSDKSIHELQDLVKKIALKEKIEESREFARDVQQALWSGVASRGSSIRDRGAKKAPFIVLIGANMPSILAEISFISNPTDEKKLQTPGYRQKIAESLYRGIARYVGGLSGVKVASKISDKQSR